MISVEYVPAHPLPALVGGEQTYLPAYFVFRDKDLEFSVSPNNPNLMVWVQSFLGMNEEEWLKRLKELNVGQ